MYTVDESSVADPVEEEEDGDDEVADDDEVAQVADLPQLQVHRIHQMANWKMSAESTALES